MKKMLCILLSAMLLCVLPAQTAVAYPLQPTQVAKELAATCEHNTFIYASAHMTRCVYASVSSHVTQSYMEAVCQDCWSRMATIIDSSELAYHDYQLAYDTCEPETYTHTYVYRCTGCRHESVTTLICGGDHAE